MSLAPVMRRRLEASPRLARGTLQLLQHTGRWIRRRVEHIEYVNTEEVESRVSLDLFLPAAWQEPVAVDDGRALLVPIGLGPKGQKLSRFHLSAEGKPASLLTLEENTILSAAALGTLLRAHGVPVDEATREDLEELCGRSRTGAPRRRVERRIAAHARSPEQADELRRWVALLDERYVLYVALQRDPDKPVEQRYVHFQQTLQLSPTTAGGAEQRSTGELGEAWVGVPISDLGFGASYHLDLGVPAELRIVAAELYGADGERLDEDLDRDRVTLEARGQPVTTAQAEVRLIVRPERRAFSREAWPTSLLVLLATIAGLTPIATGDPAPAGLAAVLLAPVAAAVALSFRAFADELTRVVLRTQQTYFLVQVAGLFITVLLLQARDVLPAREDLPDPLRQVAFGARIAAVAVLLLAAALGAIIQWRAFKRSATRT